MFTQQVIEKLQYYVYALLDPATGRPFYVGKGKGNRVFAHAEGAVAEQDVVSEKIDTIRAIQARGEAVQHVIIRHGMDETTALHVESALLDFCKHVIDLQTTNLVLGHGSDDVGVMTAGEIVAKYQAPPLEALGKDCVIINISKTYQRAKGAQAYYQATKEAWVLGDRSGLRYALAAYRGFIVEVFEIDSWYPVPSQSKSGKPTTRWGFEGRVANEAARQLYANKTIPRRKGASNPVMRQLPKAKEQAAA